MQSNRTKTDARRAAALTNPESVYRWPTDVLDDPALDAATRQRVLEGWALDEGRLMVAADENMGGGRPDRLAAVASALRLLEGVVGTEPR